MKTTISILTTILFSFSLPIFLSASDFHSNGWCSDSAELEPVSLDNNSWVSWGINPTNHRFVNEQQTILNNENVGRLKLKWAFAIPDVDAMRSQPAVAGDWLYLAGRDGILRALDSRIGCIRWESAFEVPLRSGITIGEMGHSKPTLVVGDDAGYVHAVNSFNGELLWSVRTDEHPHTWITGTPIQYKGVVYVPVSSIEVAVAQYPEYECCTFRGKVVALNGLNGEFIWEYITVETDPVEQGANASGTTLWGPSGAPVWSSITVDEARNRLYFGTGQNLSQPWTHESSAIHALDLETGKRQWIFQGTEGDAWNAACVSGKFFQDLPEDHSDNCPENFGPDFDFGAAPILMSLPDGRDILVAGQKSSVVFGLDPDQNGKKIWETRVGRGGMLGGVHWGMAGNNTTVFVPNSDRLEGIEYDLPPKPGISAINASDGNVLWTTSSLKEICDDKPGCFSGFSAPATAIPGAVIAGALDGYLQIFDAENGARLWSFDTAREFETVNGIKGNGGSMDVAGPVVAGNMLYVVSGYSIWLQMPGNLLLAFSVEP